MLTAVSEVLEEGCRVEEDRSSFAYKLARLFATIHPASRGEYSPEEVSRAIGEAGGATISPAYIYMLRSGERANPTKNHMEVLADFFGVSAAYFLDEEAAERIERQLDLLAAFRDGSVRRIAARANGLSTKSLGGILAMIDAAREIEGLPEPSPHQSNDDGGEQAYGKQ